MDELETLIVGMLAHVDRIVAEIKDPAVSEERKEQLLEEARALYNVLIKL